MNNLDVNQLEKGRNAAEKILEGLRSPLILPVAYPMLFNIGIAEGTLHSYMLSGLVLLGDRLGYSAVCDSPIFDALDNLLLGEGNKRPDCVWFERISGKIKVLIEFERYKPGAIEAKVKNLLIMSKPHLQDLGMILLIYWSEHVRTEADLGNALELARRGFRASGSQYGPPTCPFLILETIVKQRDTQVTIESFAARYFLAKGENKDHIVDILNISR